MRQISIRHNQVIALIDLQQAMTAISPVVCWCHGMRRCTSQKAATAAMEIDPATMMPHR